MRNPRFALFVLLTISIIWTGLVFLWQQTDFSTKSFTNQTTATSTPATTPYRGEGKPALYKPLATTTAYLLVDLTNNITIVEKNSDLKLPIASITKLMTAVVATENIAADSTIKITKQILDTFGESGRLQEGEVISQRDLLYALLLESSNDAGTALASMMDTKNFIAAMNAKARELGMQTTTFADGSGMSDRNVSTAEDIRILVKYILAEHPNIFAITRLPSYKTATHVWYNFNIFSSNKNFVGGKTGFTNAAKETMAAVFTLPNPTKQEPHTVLAITLGSGNRKSDIQALVATFSQRE
jgi:serine-type D-Ala-D-Ala carboxypeptidase (penicillin-binding protein 5/6)